MRSIRFLIVVLIVLTATLHADDSPAKPAAHAKLGAMAVSGSENQVLTVTIHGLDTQLAYEASASTPTFKTSSSAPAATYNVSMAWLALDYGTPKKIKSQITARLRFSEVSTTDTVAIAEFKKSDFLAGDNVRLSGGTLGIVYLSPGGSIRDVYNTDSLATALRFSNTGLTPSQIEFTVQAGK